jgi:hypothetical protein
MTNIIKFIAQDPSAYEVCLKPFPASQAVPKYWKDATPYTVNEKNPKGNKLIFDGIGYAATFKKCTPMLDSITSGYVFPLWADVHIQQINGSPNISWKVESPVFETHDSSGIPTIAGYNPQAFKYINKWIPKLPKGYSAFITPVAGNPDAIYRPISAIIDYDASPHELVPPGYIKEGFEGIIEKGTPMFQLTPFKRESWQAEFNFLPEGKYQEIKNRDLLGTIVNNYVKHFWSKKSYK